MGKPFAIFINHLFLGLPVFIRPYMVVPLVGVLGIAGDHVDSQGIPVTTGVHVVEPLDRRPR